MSKAEEYKAKWGTEVPDPIVIGAIEPIKPGTLVTIPGLGEAQIQERIPGTGGNYKVVTTEVFGDPPNNVFIVKPVQAIKWYIVTED